MRRDVNRYIRFDWAMKRMLRDKANYKVLEGLLTSLLGKEIRIKALLESESNRQYDENKQNRVDILAENHEGEKILIEIQNETEDSYFHRMLFGTSRLVSEYLRKGQDYGKTVKVYSVNIVYFDLGIG
ncbi:MAG: Rpn family recombination-promoting nuclease/putative transposase, partial [Muribaculaceae bacterium]|nr:Rpn family recombination-promoting nuclease/putative transposase [Muribaculaceae bacterium]